MCQSARGFFFQRPDQKPGFCRAGYRSRSDLCRSSSSSGHWSSRCRCRWSADTTQWHSAPRAFPDYRDPAHRRADARRHSNGKTQPYTPGTGTAAGGCPARQQPVQWLAHELGAAASFRQAQRQPDCHRTVFLYGQFVAVRHAAPVRSSMDISSSLLFWFENAKIITAQCFAIYRMVLRAKKFCFFALPT